MCVLLYDICISSGIFILHLFKHCNNCQVMVYATWWYEQIQNAGAMSWSVMKGRNSYMRNMCRGLMLGWSHFLRTFKPWLHSFNRATVIAYLRCLQGCYMPIYFYANHGIEMTHSLQLFPLYFVALSESLYLCWWDGTRACKVSDANVITLACFTELRLTRLKIIWMTSLPYSCNVLEARHANLFLTGQTFSVC